MKYKRGYDMKRTLVLLVLMVVSTSFSGCVTVRKVVRERVDQDVSGNQGYLMGSGDAEYKSMPTDREYIDIRVEVPTWNQITAPAVRYEEPVATKKKPVYSDTASGNKGYISGRSSAVTYPSSEKPETATVYEYDDYEIAVYDEEGDVFVYEEEVIRPAYQEYTVKQGETLSHIAKAFYGKASKWTVIYEANAGLIKDPARLRPGMKIKIPDLREYKSGYVK
jgi:LysM repeat protein